MTGGLAFTIPADVLAELRDRTTGLEADVFEELRAELQTNGDGHSPYLVVRVVV